MNAVVVEMVLKGGVEDETIINIIAKMCT